MHTVHGPSVMTKRVMNRWVGNRRLHTNVWCSGLSSEQSILERTVLKLINCVPDVPDDCCLTTD